MMGKNLLRLAIALVLGVAASMAHAEIPAAYYSSLEGKKDAELKTATYQVIHNLTRVSSYNDLPRYFQSTDVYPDPDDPSRLRWWDMYSDIPLYAPSFKGLNREHSFPKSWWGGLTNVNAYVDLNHLYPAEAAANMAKSNYPLGEVDVAYKLNFDNGMTRVGYAVTGQGGGAKYVFEPDDEYKGDFARTYFYMVTCYQDYVWKQQYMYMLEQNAYPTLNEWSVQLLLKWSRQDPVSEKETQRNEAVWAVQNNRNPFIDFPVLAEYIWGSHKGEAFSLANAGYDPEPVGDPELLTPIQDMALDFGQVALGKSVEAKLFFKGHDLRGKLSLIIYRADKEMFSIPTKSIDCTLVNSDDGYWLTVTYTPTSLGRHTSRLVISDGGLEGSRGVELIGECLEAPELHPCVANAASDITDDSYLASWEAPENDVIDYFVLTRTRYINGAATEEKLLAEDSQLLIEGFDQSDSEAYYVQSSRLGYLSDPSNVVFVEHAGITGVEIGQPLVVIGLEGALRIKCSAPHTGCVIYDALGRQVAQLPEVADNTDIDLPLGIYLVVTDQCRRPIKAAVK